jgi:DNA mismatch endonuclease (patch repair protein)
MTRDPATTSRIMSAVRNRDTKPKMTLRRALHARGLRYRLRSSLPGRPGIVFGPAKVAVFVDGDYWHGKAWRTRGHASFEAYYGRGDNADFWLERIRRNMARDREVAESLEAAGWTVLRCWESDIELDLPGVTDRVKTAVQADGIGMAKAAA